MLSSLENIRSAFSHTRIYLVLLLVSNVTVLLCVALFSWQFKSAQGEKIYALEGEKSLMSALNQNTTDNRLVEAEATVRDFHELFFTIYPDKAEIDYRMQRALGMSDNSVYTVYKNLSDNRYFEQIKDARIVCKFKCDSVAVDFSHYPYDCRMWGKTSIVRTSSTSFRNLVTRCQLRNTARSSSMPHGFLIENWEVEDNSDIDGVWSLF